MKKDYKRDTEDFGDRWFGRYDHRYRGWYRNPRTQQERRELKGFDREGLPVRRRRLNLPTAYDDLRHARVGGRSWKDYTKFRHQWEVR